MEEKELITVFEIPEFLGDTEEERIEKWKKYKDSGIIITKGDNM